MTSGMQSDLRVISNMTDRIQTVSASESTLWINDKEREVYWEAAAIDRGRERYHATFSTVKKGRDGAVKHESAELGDVAPGQMILKEMMVAAIPYFHAAIEEAKSAIGTPDGRKGPHKDWWWLIGWLSAEEIALVTARTILTEKASGDTYQGRGAAGLNLRIGQAIKEQIEFNKWKKNSKLMAPAKEGFDFADWLIKKVGGTIDRRTWARWKAKMDSIQNEDWPPDTRVHIGAKLLDLMINHGGGWFEQRMVYRNAKTERRIFLSAAAQEALVDINAQLEVNRPYMVPMRCQPNPWIHKYNDKGSLVGFEGGYEIIQHKLMRKGMYSHTASFPEAISDRFLDAINVVQKAEWEVNDFILDTIMAVRQEGGCLGGLPTMENETLPKALSDEEWELMDQVERTEWKLVISKIHEDNAKMQSKRESLIRKLDMARSLRGETTY